MVLFFYEEILTNIIKGCFNLSLIITVFGKGKMTAITTTVAYQKQITRENVFFFSILFANFSGEQSSEM